MTRDPLESVVVAYDELCTFEFGVVAELFGLERPEFESWYRLRVAGVEKGQLRAAVGVMVDVPHTLKILDTAGTIFIPGWRSPDAQVPPVLCNKLRRAVAEGARVLSVCSGAFVLAAAGLLNGKRAATHWRYADELARRYPDITVDPDVLYVDQGNVLTSAGSAAGIDMGLHLIRRDFGGEVANAVARRLVVPPHREGGQKQYVQQPVPNDPDEQSFARVLETVRGSLAEQHTVATMARLAGNSRRTFARRFRETCGTTPHRWLQIERSRHAQRLLETTSLPLDRIAEAAGFSDAQLLRLHFKRVVGTAPSDYRRRFQARSTA